MDCNDGVDIYVVFSCGKIVVNKARLEYLRDSFT